MEQYAEDKPSVFTLADHGSGDRYVLPAKADDESTIRLLLADHGEESLTVYTDVFRVYEPLDASCLIKRIPPDGERLQPRFCGCWIDVAETIAK